MPKVKSKKSVLRRFKLTKTGKVTHRSSFLRHLKRKKSSAHKRRMNVPSKVTGRLRKKLTSILSR